MSAAVACLTRCQFGVDDEALVRRGRQWVMGQYDRGRIAESYERAYEEAVRSRTAVAW